MDEQKITERVKSAEPIANIFAQIPVETRDVARIAMQSFSAGFIAGNAAQSAQQPRIG